MQRVITRKTVMPLDYDSMSQDEKSWFMAQTLSMAHGSFMRQGVKPTEEQLKAAVVELHNATECRELRQLYKDVLAHL
jgi:hypothetical protein